MIKLLNIDCMEYMATVPDKHFDLAIVDPPYRDENKPTKAMRDKMNGKMKTFGQKPTAEYFDQLFRVSKNQIIWGANNFWEHLKSTNCFLFWYKRNPMHNYSDGELAWASFNKVARCIPIDHFGSHTRDKIKTHPTQKPVDLYKWLLKNYGCPGNKVLDTHLGSGSSAIAAHYFGCDFVGCEIDKEYFDAAQKRFKQLTAQTTIF